MKKVSFGAKPSSTPTPPSSADDWVHDRQRPVAEPTKRLTIDIPQSLHRRVKTGCAIEGVVMADEVRDFLEERFPPTTRQADDTPTLKADDTETQKHDVP